MKSPCQKIFAQFLVVIIAITLGAKSANAAVPFLFEFNTNGILPSAQGATYVGTGAESAVFQVTNGLLRQNTTVLPQNGGGYYEITNRFEHTLPTVMEWRCQVLNVTCGPGGGYCGKAQTVFLHGNGLDFGFFIQPGQVEFWNGSNNYSTLVVTNTTNAMHTYRVEIPALQSNFSFYVDGVLLVSNHPARVADNQTSFFYWGDGTPTGGNAAVDWDFVRLYQTPPIPPSINLESFQGEGTNTTCIPLSMRLRATTQTGSYPIRRVDYFDGTDPIGSSTNAVRNWVVKTTPLAHGAHMITAQAIDSFGGRATSQVVAVTLKWPGLHQMHASLATNGDVVCCMGALLGSNYVVESATVLQPSNTLWHPYLTNLMTWTNLVFTNYPVLPQRYFRARLGQ